MLKSRSRLHLIIMTQLKSIFLNLILSLVLVKSQANVLPQTQSWQEGKDPSAPADGQAEAAAQPPLCTPSVHACKRTWIRHTFVNVHKDFSHHASRS